MEIPLAFCTCKMTGSPLAHSITFEGTVPICNDDGQPLKGLMPSVEEESRGTVIIADIRGLAKREMDEWLLKRCNVPGYDIWYLTHIGTDTDVMDGFMGNIEKLVIPYHTIDDDSAMEDAFNLSENCIPAIFVLGGSALCPDGQRPLREAVRKMTDIGFTRTIVMDIDGGLADSEWESLIRDRPDIIPYRFGRPVGTDDRIIDVL